ncbi:MAG: hypothetical protein WC205_06045 [Opitutaceae bacterium]|jgi:hypothetical protein
MKSIRILLVCSFAAVASAAFVRAEAAADKKSDTAATCPVEKKAEVKVEKSGGCCSGGACTMPEKKEDKKS